MSSGGGRRESFLRWKLEKDREQLASVHRKLQQMSEGKHKLTHSAVREAVGDANVMLLLQMAKRDARRRHSSPERKKPREGRDLFSPLQTTESQPQNTHKAANSRVVFGRTTSTTTTAATKSTLSNQLNHDRRRRTVSAAPGKRTDRAPRHEELAHDPWSALENKTNMPMGHGFREEISMESVTSGQYDDAFSSEQTHQSPPPSRDLADHVPHSRDYAFVPHVSYSPPLSPAMKPSYRDDLLERNRELRYRHRSRPVDKQVPDQHMHANEEPTAVEEPLELAQEETGAHVPVVNVLVVVGCMVVGVGGFFIEDVIQRLGFYTKTTLVVLSQEEQQGMHRRLESLQQELLGFRSAASEIETHSHKVFSEVKRHLDRMRTERERHQDMIAQEMISLRKYMLRLTYEMVEQEREVIHQRLMETIRIRVDEAVSVESKTIETTPPPQVQDAVRENGAALQANAAETPVAEREDRPQDDPPTAKKTVRAPLKIETKAETSDKTQAATAAPVLYAPVPKPVKVRSPKAAHVVMPLEHTRPAQVTAPVAQVLGQSETPASVGFFSWGVLLVLLLVSLFGAVVAWRAHTVNRRKQWFAERRLRRQRQRQDRERIAREREQRRQVRYGMSDTEDELPGDDAQPESSSVETVSMHWGGDTEAGDSDVETVSLLQWSQASSDWREQSNQQQEEEVPEQSDEEEASWMPAGENSEPAAGTKVSA